MAIFNSYVSLPEGSSMIFPNYTSMASVGIFRPATELISRVYERYLSAEKWDNLKWEVKNII